MQFWSLPSLSLRFAAPLSLLAMALGLSGCGTAHIVGCVPANGLTPDCRFANPEDLAVSPAGTALLVSEMGRGSVDSRSGRLLAYFPVTEGASAGDAAGQIHVLWPRTGRGTQAIGLAPVVIDPLGDPTCPKLPLGELAPHGIDLQQLDDGRQVLFVVNHAVRESIEIFEVEDDGREVRLQHAGCVLAPAEASFNDVVGLRDGGFRVSSSFPASDNVVVAALRMRYGKYRPGFAWQWRPVGGYSKIAGSDVAYANGIEQSVDERFVYLAGYFENAVVKIDTQSGQRVAVATIHGPDNLTWSRDGRLLVASQYASTVDLLRCLSIEGGACGIRFRIVELDPQNMAQRTIIDHAGPPIGAVTVAVPFAERLYLGTFAGDRLAWR